MTEQAVESQVQQFAEDIGRLKAEMGKMIVGQEEIVEGVISCLLADGHALLEGVPGLGKTMLVRTLAETVDVKFSRIQFTPDLMPADITGTDVIEEDRTTGKREFRFDPNQEFQVKAIEAVCDLFDGQVYVRPHVKFELTGEGTCGAVANRLDIGEGQILENLRAVQRRNGIRPDSRLEFIEDTIETAEGKKPVRFPNFSVEMETGTGKTYVYLRTALELNQRYGMRKFIVVVPSVAIREGVLKTLKITEKHFREFFGNPVYRYYVYDSANLSQVRQFALSDAVEIMVMTIDSFNKAANVIRQSTDRLQGETPIHLVQAARPILILDEPQNMESEKAIAALSLLNPLFALRYSATHRNPYNVVYRLTPAEAYRQGLVKKIEVDSVVRENEENRPVAEEGKRFPLPHHAEQRQKRDGDQARHRQGYGDRRPEDETHRQYGQCALTLPRQAIRRGGKQDGEDDDDG